MKRSVRKRSTRLSLLVHGLSYVYGDLCESGRVDFDRILKVYSAFEALIDVRHMSNRVRMFKISSGVFMPYDSSKITTNSKIKETIPIVVEWDSPVDGVPSLAIIHGLSQATRSIRAEKPFACICIDPIQFMHAIYVHGRLLSDYPDVESRLREVYSRVSTRYTSVEECRPAQLNIVEYTSPRLGFYFSQNDLVIDRSCHVRSPSDSSSTFPWMSPMVLPKSVEALHESRMNISHDSYSKSLDSSDASLCDSVCDFIESSLESSLRSSLDSFAEDPFAEDSFAEDSFAEIYPNFNQCGYLSDMGGSQNRFTL